MDVREISGDLFGRPCRLPFALWILERDKPRFFQSEPPREIDSPTALRQELERFVRLGMLVQDRPDAENRVYYERTDSPLWQVIEAARSVVSGQ